MDYASLCSSRILVVLVYWINFKLAGQTCFLLLLCLSKCRELVFKRPNKKTNISLCTLPDVARVNSVKLFGVNLDCTLCFHEHVLLKMIKELFSA